MRRRQVLDDDQRGRVERQIPQQAAERVQSAGRGADADDQRAWRGPGGGLSTGD
jgi:hypothetical protein